MNKERVMEFLQSIVTTAIKTKQAVDDNKLEDCLELCNDISNDLNVIIMEIEGDLEND